MRPGAGAARFASLRGCRRLSPPCPPGTQHRRCHGDAIPELGPRSCKTHSRFSSKSPAFLRAPREPGGSSGAWRYSEGSLAARPRGRRVPEGRFGAKKKKSGFGASTFAGLVLAVGRQGWRVPRART